METLLDALYIFVPFSSVQWFGGHMNDPVLCNYDLQRMRGIVFLLLFCLWVLLGRIVKCVLVFGLMDVTYKISLISGQVDHETTKP